MQKPLQFVLVLGALLARPSGAEHNGPRGAAQGLQQFKANDAKGFQDPGGILGYAAPAENPPPIMGIKGGCTNSKDCGTGRYCGSVLRMHDAVRAAHSH
jgi:hypothetical protein